MIDAIKAHKRLAQLNHWPRRLIRNLEAHEEVNKTVALSFDCPTGHYCLGLSSDDRIKLNNAIPDHDLDKRLFLRCIETL